MNAYQMHLFEIPLPRAFKETAPAATGTAYNTTEAVSAIAVSATDLVLQKVDQVARDWWSKLSEAQQKSINGRKDRALSIAKAGMVHFTESADIFKVLSSSVKGEYFYTVTLAPARTCTCPDHKEGGAPGGACKHILAAYFISKALLFTVETPEPEMPAAPEPQPEPAPISSVEGAVVASFAARPYLQREAIIWAVAVTKSGDIPVEILSMDDDLVQVRALPKLVNGVMLPCFPFTSPHPGSVVPYSTATLSKSCIKDVASTARAMAITRHDLSQVTSSLETVKSIRVPGGLPLLVTFAVDELGYFLDDLTFILDYLDQLDIPHRDPETHQDLDLKERLKYLLIEKGLKDMKLGMLYRKYLRGDDLAQNQSYNVEILAIKLVQVQPHPTAPKQDKWCLMVKGLPEDLPNAILVGPKAGESLVELFGNIDLNELKGKRLNLFKKFYSIAGAQKASIGFRAPAADPKPGAPAPRPAAPATKTQVAKPARPAQPPAVENDIPF